MPGERSQTLTWVGQVDLLRGSAGRLWGPLDFQGEEEEQTAAGPAGTEGTHGRGKVRSRGRGWVLQASAGGAERMGEGGGSQQREEGSRDGREVFTGSACPDAGEKTKASITHD